MELLSVVLARSALLFEVDSLDPFGRLSAVEALAQIKERYGFAIVPQKPGESTTEKGAEFLSGRMGDTVIDRLTLFHNGIVVDTRSSTEESEKIADDFVGKARDILGSRVRVERRHLASQITFRSQLVLSRMNPVIEEICEEIQRTVGAGLKQEFVAEPIGLTIHTDVTQTRFAPAKFSIERRADAPFFENTYFSGAPLSTQRHLALVEKFERSLL